MQESRLVEDVAVAVNQLDEFIGGVVLELYVGNEPCTTEFRKDVALELGIDGRHVLDLAFTDPYS